MLESPPTWGYYRQIQSLDREGPSKTHSSIMFANKEEMMKKDYRIVRPPLPPGVKLEENVYVKMRDGVKIAVDIYRPEAEGRYPAILGMLPYMKELQQWPPMLTHSIEAGNTGFFVSKGYVHVIAQVRGTGFSQGQWNNLDTKEQQDGYDLVEWIAKQPWCNGNVGMLGDSYFAMIQYLVAAQRPPHLKCIVPYDGNTDIYRDLCYQGGLFYAWFMGMWLPDTIDQALWPGPIEGKLPPANLLVDMLSHAEDGPYYWERDGATKIDKIDVPVLSITPQTFVHVRGQLYVYPMIKSPKKLVVLNPAGAFAHVQFIQNPLLSAYILRWFDHWLKGIDTGIMGEPEVAILDSGTQEWRYENQYPLARTKWTKYYLRSNPAGPSTQAPYGLMNVELPTNEQPDRYKFPDSAGLVFFGQPVLAYATPPLSQDLRVWGPISFTLYGSSTTLDTAWFVYLGEVAPDGKVTLFNKGILKASFREVDESKSRPGQPFHSFQNPVLPEANKVYEYQIELRPIFHTFKAGYKIWIQIASIDFEYQMLLHSVYSSEMLPVPAENVVYHDSAHPSHVLLPVIPDSPAIKPVPPELSEIKWPPSYQI